jgi:small subunit ribosomal protein S20
MPILPSAKKALRSSRAKAVVNSRIKSRVRSTQKQMVTDPTQENLESAYSAIDKAVKKHLFHTNKAARLKSQIAKLASNKLTKVKKSTTKTASAKKQSSSKKTSTAKKTAKKSN